MHDHPCLVFLEKPLKLSQNNINLEDPYPWLNKEDPQRHMTDMEILKLKVKPDNSILDKEQKENFYNIIHQNRNVFSMWDKIESCLQIQIHLKLCNETPFFVRTYPIREEQKSIVKQEMDRLENLGIIKKGLTGYSSQVLLVKRRI